MMWSALEVWRRQVHPTRVFPCILFPERTEGQAAAARAAEADKSWPHAMRAPLQVADGVLPVPFGPWVAKDKQDPPKSPEEDEARRLATLLAFDAATC